MSRSEYNLKGLRNTLIKYGTTGDLCVEGTHWKIAVGGYDLLWELYYRDRQKGEIPVIGCFRSDDPMCSGELENYCLSQDDFNRIADIITDEYPVKIQERSRDL